MAVHSLSFVAAGIALGIAYAATPGVVNTECARRGIARGFRAGFLVQAGALLGDAVWAIVALTSVATLAQQSAVRIGLGALGGAFLLRLGFRAVREMLAPASTDGAVDASPAGGSLRTGLIFGLANPAGLAFWAGVGGGAIAADAPVGDYAAFLTAFLAGALLWSLFLSGLVAWGRRFATPRVFRAVDGITGALLSLFGVRLLWSAYREWRAA